PDILQKLQSIDLLFIDGNHSYEATLRYFNLCKPYLHNDSLLIFDDIYWSKGMTNAWEEIKADPMVKVSVDLFFIGLVFFRKEQVKENFKLRIL
ncbi:MAG: class I SAM-dependent methyltransferase, partial [Bacteroidia bacterium]